MVVKNLCIPVLWVNVALALKGLIAAPRQKTLISTEEPKSMGHDEQQHPFFVVLSFMVRLIAMFILDSFMCSLARAMYL